MTKLTPEQIKTVDKVVLAAIGNSPRPPRAADLLRVPAISKVLNTFPQHKEAFRYLDNSLQRLRKRGCIETTSDGWCVTHGRP